MKPRFYALALLGCLFAFAFVARGQDALTYQVPAGPWGRIEYQYVYLAAPENILDEFPVPSPIARWCFEDRSMDWVRTFLAGAGVDIATSNRLLNDPRSQPDEEGVITLFPTEADLLALSPISRDMIYHELGKFERNPFFHDPILIPDGNLDAWLRGTNFPPNVVDLIRKLSYRDGSAMFFGDLRSVLKYAKSDAEARQWVKWMTRVRAVVAYLKIDSTDNLTALRKYWSANFHRTDSLPFLDASAQIPGGVKVDLIHLLPPLPRRLVYSYTSPDIERTGQTPNCHWTSLNFFNYTRQNILLDLKLATSRVMESYDRALPPYQFGDVLFFLNKDGNAYHSCVFITENLVFSKNGENQMMPWILTRLEDIKQLYGREPGYRIEFFRRRWSEN